MYTHFKDVLCIMCIHFLAPLYIYIYTYMCVCVCVCVCVYSNMTTNAVVSKIYLQTLPYTTQYKPTKYTFSK